MKKRAVKIVVITFSAAACLAALLLFLRARGLFIPCVFNVVTRGLKCPACGATRATMRLLTLDFRGAWGYNPFILFIWAYIIKLYADFSLTYIREGEFIKKRFDWFDIGGAAAVVVWGIVRNILRV